jgi:hypothetical protein
MASDSLQSSIERRNDEKPTATVYSSDSKNVRVHAQKKPRAALDALNDSRRLRAVYHIHPKKSGFGSFFTGLNSPALNDGREQEFNFY